MDAAGEGLKAPEKALAKVGQLRDPAGKRASEGPTMTPRQHSEAWFGTAMASAEDGNPRAELDLTEVFTGPRDIGRGRTCKENEAKYSKNSFMAFPGSSESIWGENGRVSLEAGLASRVLRQ